MSSTNGVVFFKYYQHTSHAFIEYVIYTGNEAKTLILLYLSYGLSYDSSLVELLVSHWAPPQVADRGTLPSHGWYRGNEIPGADKN